MNPGSQRQPASGKTSVPAAPVAAWWLVICAFWSVMGWVLSAFSALNRTGYAVSTLLLIALLFILRKQFGWPHFSLQLLGRRFRRPFPLAFLVLAVMAALGGILYAPTNYDALAYRTPRILNWLAEGRWHWIHTEFNRLNTRAMGFEWLQAPLMVLTGTDRLVFLINIISLLLLPGLVFSTFVRLGIKARVAWHWMWLTPTGYCFLLQAGGIANDLFGAVFALASLDFALRARQQRNGNRATAYRDFWFSVLSAALMTGSKATNLPLLLPWAIAMLPSLHLLRRRWLGHAAVGLVALTVSLVPLILINLKYSGDWTGIKAEKVEALESESLLNVANNAVLLTIQNLAPPVFPVAGKWNSAVQHAMPEKLKAKLEKAFEPGGAHWELGELQIEEAAGLGFGVSGLVVLSCLACMARRGRQLDRPAPSQTWQQRAIVGSVWISLAAFMIKSGLTNAARLITPYYALLIPSFLLCRHQFGLIRTRWWQGAAYICFGFAGLLLVLSPARPLWPANTVLAQLPDHSALAVRARSVYSVFRTRADAFAPARRLLPQDEKVIGLIASDDPETSLWRPFGSRRIVNVAHDHTGADLRRMGIHYVVVNPKKLAMFFGRTFEQWLADVNGETVTQVTLPLRVTLGPSDWFIVRLRPARE